MKRKIKVVFLLIVGIILIYHTKVQAKSYYIENMDIQATVLENGDLEVEQNLEYVFEGQYNGIYITIPTTYKNQEEVISEISDNIYNVQGIELKKVSVVDNTNEIIYKKVNNSYNGQSGVYTEDNSNGMYTLKVFSVSSNTHKKFKIAYTLKNLCVLHNDFGELYYNFIGGKWQCSIKKLNIDIYTPNNKETLKIWGHGPDNGVSKIIDNTHSNFKVTNVATGKYVAARLLFDKENIKNSTKISNLDAYNIIYKQESNIARISDKKKNYTKNIYIFALILLGYWVVLLIIYEKDKKYVVTNYDEQEIFNKYNPMIAGALQGNRDILARDIIAVILNLINKKNIDLELKSSYNDKNKYDYYLTRVKDKENTLDEIEKVVYTWLFGTKQTVELGQALKEMPKDKNANDKFKTLNNLTQSELNKKVLMKKRCHSF